MSFEVTWSLMHPTELDVDYMHKVIHTADQSKYKVDSFEICGECHALRGGLDGLSLYEKYPHVSAQLNHHAIADTREKLTRILELAHATHREVYYWHREVVVPGGLIESEQGLLDENGEFDLLGDAYEALIKYKLEQAFNAIPTLDGIVLTLTEADFSVIHHSNPEKYNPAKVVAKIAGIFYDELSKRGKRFILRSFGSIAKDYEDILAGAALLEKTGRCFEVETKITPYDFNPFLFENPFLHHVGSLELGAECDALGEFLGAGNFPAQNVENIIRYVDEAKQAGVNRYVIRIDRANNSVLDTYPVNLEAFMCAINDKEPPKWDPSGLEAILKTLYIDGNLIFHTFPVSDFKYLKAGGFFAFFKEDISLKNLEGIWSVLAKKNTLTHYELLEEKRQAIELAEKQDSPLGKNLLYASKAIDQFCKCVIAYFDDMNDFSKTPLRLNKEVKIARQLKSDDNYTAVVHTLSALLKEEYSAEFLARKEILEQHTVSDLIIPGSISDEWRCVRVMHGCHAELNNERPCRIIGNKVFPNGTLDLQLNAPKGTKKLFIKGKGNFKINIADKVFEETLNGGKIFNIDSKTVVDITLAKGQGINYPRVFAVAALV